MLRKIVVVNALIALLLVVFLPSVIMGHERSNERVITGTQIKKDISEAFENLELGDHPNVDLILDNSSLDDNKMTLNGTIYNENQESLNFNVKGELFNSINQEHGYSSYVGDLNDVTGNFEVLYFMIKNDNNHYEYLFNKDLASQQMFLLYLRDPQSKDVYVFESSLSELGVSKGIEKLNLKEYAETSDDFLWFAKVVDPIDQSVEEIENITPFSNNNAVNSTRHTRTSKYGGGEIKETIVITVNSNIIDVGTSGTSQAYSTLSIKQTTHVNGSFHSNSSNFMIHRGKTSLRNLIGQIALGYNTVANETQWYGNYREHGKNQNILDIGKSILPWELGSVFDVFNIESADVKERRNIEHYGVTKNSHVRISKNKGLYLKNNNDKITLKSNISTYKSSASANYFTSARFGWTFDVYYEDGGADLVQGYTNFGNTIYYLSNVK